MQEDGHRDCGDPETKEDPDSFRVWVGGYGPGGLRYGGLRGNARFVLNDSGKERYQCSKAKVQQEVAEMGEGDLM
jgi:hypothetical protein